MNARRTQYIYIEIHLWNVGKKSQDFIELVSVIADNQASY